MRNAKQEFLEHTEEQTVLWANIRYEKDWNSEPINIVLKLNHSTKDYENFLNQLDFEYDHGYGTQHLFGTIAYIDNTWSERYEYDGSERWDYNAPPQIPKECL